MDVTSWLTKQQAAEAIGCSTKTIEALAKDRKLQQDSRKSPAGAHVAVYHPGDVERIRQERNPSPQPFVLPPGAVSESSQNSANAAESTAVVPISETSENRIAAVLEVMSRPRFGVPLWLTEAQAVEYSGIGITHLEKMVEWRKIGRKGSLVCRRRDLDAL